MTENTDKPLSEEGQPPRLRTLEAPVALETNLAMAQPIIHRRSPLFI
ncbi:MAG: hypothetical protein HY790_06240 [Deltaproteobacteria bacterium]|nr:hypothetical protein [Deltaproteobacteria bacterium]MBI4795426.1 hypothetical protein [Deltaproteobacteria bacterium]